MDFIISSERVCYQIRNALIIIVLRSHAIHVKDARKYSHGLCGSGHIGYGKATAAVGTLTYLASHGIGGEESQQFAEHGRLIIGLVILAYEVDKHLALFEHHLLYAESAGHSSQTWYAQEFSRHIGYGSEAVNQALFKFLKVRFAFY